MDNELEIGNLLLPPQEESSNIMEPNASENEEDNLLKNNGEQPRDETPPVNEGAFGAFASVLQKEGLLDIKEGQEIKSTADLTQAYRDTYNSRKENFIKSYQETLKPEAKQYLGLVDNGVDPKEAQAVIETLSYLNGLTEEQLNSENIQEAIYAESLKQKGHSDAAIKEYVSEAKDLEKLQSRATAAKVDLVSLYNNKNEELKRLAQEQKEKQEESRNSFNNNLKELISTSKSVGSLEISDELRTKLENAIYNPAGYDSLGQPKSKLNLQRDKNPAAFEMALHLYSELGLFDMDEKGSLTPNFDVFKNMIKTQATDELASFLTGDSGSTHTPSNSLQGELDSSSILNQLK